MPHHECGAFSTTCQQVGSTFVPMVCGATENWFAYVLALIVRVFRPHGLFGEKIIEGV